MSATAEIVWQCDAYGKTLAQAVAEFSRTHWARPRKHTPIDAEGRFKMRDGVATYQCAISDNDRPVWRIVRLAS